MKLISIKTLASILLCMVVIFAWNGCGDTSIPLPSPSVLPGVNGSNRITADVVWPDINSDPNVPDYRVRGNIVIEDIVMLTIMPGVVIEFLDASDGITVENGAISAVGTASQPIIFKGYRDVCGSWIGLNIYSNDQRNELSYCQIFNAGAENNGSKAAIQVKGNLGIYPSAIKISHTKVAKSCGFGITIDKVSRFTTFSENSFTTCDLAPMRITNKQLGALDSLTSYFGNTLNYIQIEGEGVIDQNVVVKRLDVPYLIENGDIRVTSGQLAIRPGCEFRFKPNTALIVDERSIGSIAAIGTALKPVVFKGTQTVRGAWKGIAIFNESSANRLIYCKIDGGGQEKQGVLNSGRANIVVGNTTYGYPQALIENCTITNSLGYGIYHGGNSSINVNPGQINVNALSVNMFNNNASGSIGN